MAHNDNALRVSEGIVIQLSRLLIHQLRSFDTAWFGGFFVAIQHV